MEQELELDLLRQKNLIIQGITDCDSQLQLVEYIYGLSKIYLEKERLDKFHKKDIESAKVLKEH